MPLDVLFDGSADDKAVYRRRPRLPAPVNAVDRLGFHRRVEERLQQKDVIGFDLTTNKRANKQTYIYVAQVVRLVKQTNKHTYTRVRFCYIAMAHTYMAPVCVENRRVGKILPPAEGAHGSVAMKDERDVIKIKMGPCSSAATDASRASPDPGGDGESK